MFRLRTVRREIQIDVYRQPNKRVCRRSAIFIRLLAVVVEGSADAHPCAPVVPFSWTQRPKLRLRHTQGGSTSLTEKVRVCMCVVLVVVVVVGDPCCLPSGQMAGLYASIVATEERGHGGIAGSSEDGQGGAFADTGHSSPVKRATQEHLCSHSPLPYFRHSVRKPVLSKTTGCKQKTL